MIRPYWTVIKDSFAEAFASRVLWILFGVLTLILLAIAPLGLGQQRASKLHRNGISDWPGLVAQIKQQSVGDAPSPGKRIWTLAGDDFRSAIDGAVREHGPPELSYETATILIDEFNRLVGRPDFFDEASWSRVELDQQWRDLIAAGVENLSKDDLSHLNRRLFHTAFPTVFARAADEELQITYFHWTVGSPIAISRRLAEPFINRILALVMTFFVGILTVFVGILVTAPIIPNMFEAGAIDLLLSKPVGRSLLFLTKFFGGCAFILLNGAYFIVGLWLIAGIRFGLWNHAMFWCIPVFLFLFTVYYSVSALAAVRWKNAIVSVVITILFWAACFTVGSAKHLIENVFLRPARIVRIVPTDGALMVVSQSGAFSEWRAGEWETMVKSDQPGGPFGPNRVLVGPVFDAKHDSLLYFREPRRRRFSLLGGGASLKKVAWKDGIWGDESGPSLPSGASWLFLDPEGRPTAVAASGVFRLTDRATDDQPKPKLWGVTLPFGGVGPYVHLGPEAPFALESPFAAAMHPTSGDVATHAAGQLRCLRRDEKGMYHQRAERDLGEPEDPAVLAFAGDRIVVAQSDGRVLLLDAADLTTRAELRPAGRSEPQAAEATRDGRHFAVLFHNGTLAMFDAEGTVQGRFFGDVSAVAFDGSEHLFVADRDTRVTKYELPSLVVIERHAAAPDLLQAVYRYFVLPFYTIFPKPGELDEVVAYLLTDQTTVVQGPPGATDPREARIKIDIHGPIWSSLAFVVVVLGVTCVYLHRMDF
ncbi:MAG TPA: hypothetical protein DD670_06585 [Planctomycetaceae bacterium]|nr:hypothetical protein [Planctomycetaceae bacterium]